MKSLKLLLMSACTILSVSVFAQTQTDSIKVSGNCGMCKSRIEKAAKIDGVTAAAWVADTKMLTVTFDASKVSVDQIQQKVAAAGHDTDKYKSEDKVYDKLPGCCHYDRKKADK
ncbi:MAG TPA: cation transporter [Phnomibacter sp.]|nr:cation transporter [Phnomibacter sp.]